MCTGVFKCIIYISAVGACVPEWQELDSELMRNSVVYCDSRDACNKESGDIIVSQVSEAGACTYSMMQYGSSTGKLGQGGWWTTFPPPPPPLPPPPSAPSAAPPHLGDFDFVWGWKIIQWSQSSGNTVISKQKCPHMTGVQWRIQDLVEGGAWFAERGVYGRKI